jgi:tetrapyrrole methylase family protein/MazG family protein
MYAQKLSRKAAAAGFEWDSIDDVWGKVHEEIAELTEAAPGSSEAVDEVGDLLFTVVNVARHLGVDAEAALRGMCARFVGRFEAMEASAADRGLEVRGLGIDEYERLWAQAKQTEGRTGDPEQKQESDR